jgi:hypothetical protein
LDYDTARTVSQAVRSPGLVLFAAIATAFSGCVPVGAPARKMHPLVFTVEHKQIVYCKYCRDAKVKSHIVTARKTITVDEQLESPELTDADWASKIKEEAAPFEREEYTGCCQSHTCRKASAICAQHGGLWEPHTCYAIAQRRVHLGMTADQARAAWGRPSDVNRTIGSWGVHEQWVYGYSSYLYFEDGVLTSIQN